MYQQIKNELSTSRLSKVVILQTYILTDRQIPPKTLPCVSRVIKIYNNVIYVYNNYITQTNEEFAEGTAVSAEQMPDNHNVESNENAD